MDNQYFPADIKTRARIQAYLQRHDQMIRTPLFDYLRAKIVFPRFLGAPELSKDKEIVHRKKVKNALITLNWILKDTGFVARTSGITIADIFAFSEIASGLMVGIDLQGYSEIKKWFDFIKVIPEVRETHSLLFDSLKGINATEKI